MFIPLAFMSRICNLSHTYGTGESKIWAVAIPFVVLVFSIAILTGTMLRQRLKRKIRYDSSCECQVDILLV